MLQIRCLPMCCFANWIFTIKENEVFFSCMHCERIQQKVCIDMYRKYDSLDEVPLVEKQEMMLNMNQMYPLYFEIDRWSENM